MLDRWTPCSERPSSIKLSWKSKRVILSFPTAYTRQHDCGCLSKPNSHCRWRGVESNIHHRLFFTKCHLHGHMRLNLESCNLHYFFLVLFFHCDQVWCSWGYESVKFIHTLKWRMFCKQFKLSPKKSKWLRDMCKPLATLLHIPKTRSFNFVAKKEMKKPPSKFRLHRIISRKENYNHL